MPVVDLAGTTEVVQVPPATQGVQTQDLAQPTEIIPVEEENIPTETKASDAGANQTGIEGTTTEGAQSVDVADPS